MALVRHLYGALERIRLSLSPTECPYVDESQAFPTELYDTIEDEPLKQELKLIKFDDIERMYKEMEKKRRKEENEEAKKVEIKPSCDIGGGISVFWSHFFAFIVLL